MKEQIVSMEQDNLRIRKKGCELHVTIQAFHIKAFVSVDIL